VAETMQSLEGLATLKPAAPEAPKYEKKIDAQGRAYATGKRKNAVARVWIAERDHAAPPIPHPFTREGSQARQRLAG